MANVAATWATVSGSEARDPTKELLNCLRVLGRVLPLVYESEGSFEEELLWTRRAKPTQSPVQHQEPEEPQFVIQEEDSDDEDAVPKPSTQSASGPSAETRPSPEDLEPALASRLLSAAIDLMFCCGLTMPTKIQVGHQKFNHTIWQVELASRLYNYPNFASLQGEGSRVNFGSPIVLLPRPEQDRGPTIYHHPPIKDDVYFAIPRPARSKSLHLHPGSQ